MTELEVVPANEAPWDDLRAVFGTRGVAYRCQCQWLKVEPAQSRSITLDERAARLRDEAGCDGARAGTSGLVAYLDGTPAGWCAVEPRSAYPRLRHLRSLWKGHEDEDLGDDDVWAVTCFVVRVGFRRRGVTRALVAAAVDHARRGGGRVVEGYPMDTAAGERVSAGDLFVGSRSVFLAAGFSEARRVSDRRSVMRRELWTAEYL